MTNKIHVAIIFLLLGRQALADSMMLSPVELEAIGITAEDTAALQQASLSDKGGQKLRLDGIVYHNENNWYVWLNGQRYSQGQQPVHHKITKVHHDTVEIVATNQDDGQAKPIVLSLGQVY